MAFWLVLIFLGPGFVGFLYAQESNSCLVCHSDYWEDMKSSVHTQHQITCDKCHGGDPTKSDKDQAKAPGTGYIGAPEKKQIAQVCGSCHADVEAMNFYGLPTDQLARYKTSVHGKKLLIDGDTHVAVCSDCHDYHNILPISDPQSTVYPANVPKTCSQCHANEKLMASYNIPGDIYQTYLGSVHGKALLEKKDLSAPHCASCHGSHGAVPPGVKEISATCGKCHINEKKYFLESPHAKALEQGKFNECIACHGNHGVKPASRALYTEACTKCHEPGTKGLQTGQQLDRLIKESEEARVSAEALVKQASIDGLFVEPEMAHLEELKTSMIEMAPLQHTLSLEKLEELHGKIVKISEDIRQTIQSKRESLHRRKSALLFLWVFIAVMVSALWTQYKRLTGHKQK